MSVKKELIDKTIIMNHLNENGKKIAKIKEKDYSEKKYFKKIKRKYRLILAFLFFFSMILIFMILPVVIAAIAQGL
ncbi:MAG: hypothetical protein KAW51_00245 [Candidatus Lokiarchaeota archaeon]|nr:hypothetical protein [Candidatus Lokiarchaeota archaeon]